MQLTETFVEQVSPPTATPNGKGSQVFYRDSVIIGFGLRVASGGAKSWILERRIRGKVKRITLGRCDVINLEKAKSKAVKLIKEIERENTPRIINGKLAAETITLQETFKEYVAAHPELSQLTIKDYQRSMRGPLREWLTTPLRDISETNILTKHRAYADKNKARCNNAMRLIRAILNYARLNLINEHHKPIIKTNPVDVLSLKQLWYLPHEKKIDAVLNTEQLKKWWHATQQLRKKTTRDYLRFLLLTGLPHAIVSRLTTHDLQIENKVIKIKIKRDHDAWLTLPLTRHLVSLLGDHTVQCNHRHDYIFPGITSEKPISDPRSAIKRATQISGVQFTLYDLHQTFMSLARENDADQTILTKLSMLYKNQSTSMTADEVDVLREIQERVSDTVINLIDKNK